jgi:peptide chain release factor 1
MKQVIFQARRKDFRIDTFRSGGPGGQHQNKSDSGVRITHLDTGLFAECRETRSQGQNRKIAFRRLADKIVSHVKAQERKEHVISNECIRTYHEPDNRVKDHKSGFTSSYSQIMADIGPMIEARHQALKSHD